MENTMGTTISKLWRIHQKQNQLVFISIKWQIKTPVTIFMWLPYHVWGLLFKHTFKSKLSDNDIKMFIHTIMENIHKTFQCYLKSLITKKSNCSMKKGFPWSSLLVFLCNTRKYFTYITVAILFPFLSL